jgi:carboxylate-amine ligase
MFAMLSRVRQAGEAGGRADLGQDGHMASIPFATSERSTIGIEWELALVDSDSGDLRQVAQTVLDAVTPEGADQHPHIRQELLLNTVEVVSGVCHTVGEAGRDLERAIDEIRTVTDPLRVELMCAGTHPFAAWNHQKVTDKERYATLIDRTQWWGRQMLIYGVHVHVGIEDRDKVLPISRAMLTVYGHLQALSASSPFWGGEETGYASNRALMFQQLPTAGLPFQFEEWNQLEGYVDDMLHTGVIDVFDEIRWDLRPSPKFGTLEVRICDGIPTMSELMSISALTHCLVEHFSSELDAGRELPTVPPWFAQENKWRSARYGMDAILILDKNAEEDLVTTDLHRLLDTLEPVAERLGCTEELAGIHQIIAGGASYQRQRHVAAVNAGELDAVVGALVQEMRAGRPVLHSS